MSQSLADDLPRASGTPGIRVWLKSSGYARRLLLGEAGDPWRDAASYLAFFNQAHSLLRPDVAVVEVAEFYGSWVARHPELKAAMDSKGAVTYPLRAMLQAEEARRLLGEVVEAVTGAMRGQTPVALAMPSPREWLRQANGLAGRAEIDIDSDHVEDAAMYMADLVRSLATRPVGGILLEDSRATGGSGDLVCYRPLVNVARHYRWALVLSQGTEGGPAPDFDAVISAAPVSGSEGAFGLDVGRALWDGAALPGLQPGQFYFAEIPVQQQPESVLEQIARMRA